MIGWLPIALFIIIGFAALVILQFPQRRFPLVGTVAFSWFAGLVIVTVLISFAAVITNKLFFIIFWILLAASITIIIWKRKDARNYFPETIHAPDRAELLKTLPLLPLIIIIVFNICTALQINLQFPVIGLDAVGNFAMKAKLWYYSHDLFPEQLKNPEYLAFKRTYPPLIPMSEAIWNYAISPHEWNAWIIKWFFVGCWISTGFLVYSAVLPRSGRYAAWMACTLWFLIPFNFTGNEDGGLNGYGDMPLGMGFLIAVLLIDEFKEAKKVPTFLILSFMTAGILLIKNESQPFFLLIAGILLFKRTSFKPLGILAGCTIIFYILYKIMTRGLPTHLEAQFNFKLTQEMYSERLHDLRSNLMHVLKADHIWGKRLWYAIFAVWVFKIVKGPWRRIISWELFLVLFMATLYTVLMIHTCFDFERNFIFSMDRLFFQLVPMLIVATFTGFEMTYNLSGKEQTSPVIDQS